MENFLTNSFIVRKFYFLVFWPPNKNYKYFFITMVMKVVKEGISMARAEITESTQWLSAKKRKKVFLP